MYLAYAWAGDVINAFLKSRAKLQSLLLERSLFILWEKLIVVGQLQVAMFPVYTTEAKEVVLLRKGCYLDVCWSRAVNKTSFRRLFLAYNVHNLKKWYFIAVFEDVDTITTEI